VETDTAAPIGAASPAAALAPLIEAKLVHIDELLDDVIQKFDRAFGAEPLRAVVGLEACA